MVGIVYVGGETEAVRNENRDKIIDSLNACKAALEKGVLPGGGAALVHASKSLLNISLKNIDQQQGVNIVRTAVGIPMKMILRNAGLNYKTIFYNVDSINTDPWIGYNVRTRNLEIFTENRQDRKHVGCGNF